ncbi:MAG: NosD domain-containing protein, partial [Candidatus Hodarchaeales archaeon]
DFAREAERNGWPGNGTAASPYRIEWLSLSLGHPFMFIYSSSVYFTIRKCNFNTYANAAILILQNTQNARIEDCTLWRGSRALRLTSCGNCTIVGNVIEKCDYAGIHIEGSASIVISDNTFSQNRIGIQLWKTAENNFTQNFFFNNTEGGILFEECEMNFIEDNRFFYGGLVFTGSNLENYDQMCESNTHNGAPLVYLRDYCNLSLSAPGQVIIVNCTNLSVENGEFEGAPIYIVYSQGIDIMNCSWTGGFHGIFVTNSSEIAFFSNNITRCSDYGAILSSSTNVTLSECHFTRNLREGVFLMNTSDIVVNNSIIAENRLNGVSLIDSANAIILNCSIRGNMRGFWISSFSTNSMLSHCSILFNHARSFLEATSSDNLIAWNNFAGYYSGLLGDDGINNYIDSNFWWDQRSPDENADGIVDHPSVVYGSANNQDAHPRTQPIGYLPPIFRNAPPPTFYALNTTGHLLKWLVLGSNPRSYTITRDEQILSQGVWESGIPIEIGIDGLPEGTYIFCLRVDDEKHSMSQDSVRVEVVYYDWGVSIGEELIWTYTKNRGPEGPYKEKKYLNVPFGNQTTEVEMTCKEGDLLRYVVTAFKVISFRGDPFPMAIGNLTIKGLKGVNHELHTLVLPVNINWTAFAGRNCHPGFCKLVVLRNTDDLFECKVVDIQDPSRENEQGRLFRYDKRRGVLLHEEYLSDRPAQGYFFEFDYVKPLSPTKQTNLFGLPLSLPDVLLVSSLLLGISLSLGVGFFGSKLFIIRRGVRRQLRQLQQWQQEMEQKRLQLLEQSTSVDLELVAGEVESMHLQNQRVYHQFIEHLSAAWLPPILQPNLQSLKELHKRVSCTFRNFEETLEQCKLLLS